MKFTPISLKLIILCVGRSFAILSGTSMAAPHIAGIGALIKQLHPSWTPAMIASAISSTATEYDNSGEVISAESYEISGLFPSNHFDYGAGHVNPAKALDPGLVLPAGKFFSYHGNELIL